MELDSPSIIQHIYSSKKCSHYLINKPSFTVLLLLFKDILVQDRRFTLEVDATIHYSDAFNGSAGPN